MSVSSSTVCPGSSFTVSCVVDPSAAAGVNSILAPVVNGNTCSWDRWDGATVVFNCTLPSSSTLGSSYSVTCAVDTSKSHKRGSDQSVTITAGGCSSVCSTYGDAGTCNADTHCEWCDDCSGTKYSGDVGRCLVKGDCSYGCRVGYCGASCDSTNGYTVSCDDYCGDGVTLVSSAQTCSADCVSGCVDVASVGCGSTSCASVYAHTVGSCANPCVDDGDRHDGRDATCGSCTPTFPGDCSCASGYFDADGVASNGCECSVTNGGDESTCDGVDNDCDGLVDEDSSDRPAANQNGLCSGNSLTCSGGSWVHASGWYSSVPEDCSLTTPDEDCDGGANYDTSDGTPADDDCFVSVTRALVDPDTVVPGGSFNLSCGSSVAGVNSIVAVVPSGFRCDYHHWSGKDAVFNCSAPLTTGSYTLTCSVDGSKSNPSGIDRSVSLTVSSGVLCYPDVDGDSYGNSSVAGVLMVSCPVGMVVDHADCDDANNLTHPGVLDVCNGVDDDCNASTVDGSGDVAPPLTGDGFSASYGVCVGYNMSCVGGSWVNDYSLVPGYEGPESTLCDGLDNDCDNMIDENVSGSCYDPFGVCEGLLDCNADSVSSGSCNTSLGCSVVPGVCDNGLACDFDHPCSSGDCHGLGCVGFVSCAGLGADSCKSYHGVGCSLTGCGDYTFRSEYVATGATACDEVAVCNWTCDSADYEEICSNGKDDDGDGLVDCLDDDCPFVSVADADVPRYNCLGTNQTGDVTGNAYYCGVSDTDPSVGLCCPAGKKPEYDAGFGLWSCQDYAPCRPPSGSCDYDYSTQFVNWANDYDCLDAGTNYACCKVVQFGNDEYYSDAGNIVVY